MVSHWAVQLCSDTVPKYLGLPQELQVLMQAAQHGKSYSCAAADLGLLRLQLQSSLDLLGLPGSPAISWQVKMAYLKSLGEADSPLVCSSLHQHPPCSACLLPAWCLCCALNVPPLIKFFNYCFSLWNASWSLGLLIPSDWKGEENPFKQFSDSL